MEKQAGRAAVIWAAAGAAAFLSLTEWYLRARYRQRVTTSRPAGEGGITIAAVGDSIVAGIEAGHGPAWPELLGRCLGAAYQQGDWHVHNAGVPGDTAPLGLGRFERDVAVVRPQLVLIAFGLNDCHLHRHALDFWFEEHLPVVATHSYLWRTLRSRGDRLLRRAGVVAQPVPESPPSLHPRTTLQGFDRALCELIRRSRATGANPVLLAMTPLAEQATEPVTARLSTYAAYNARIAEVAARTGVPLVRPGRAPRGVWLDDGLHLTSEGQAWLAGEVFTQLEHRGLWRELLRKVPDGE